MDDSSARGSFRFGFDPPDTSNGAEISASVGGRKERETSPPDERFVIDVQESAHARLKAQKKNKGTGKKKKKKKGKGKRVEEDPRHQPQAPPVQEVATGTSATSATMSVPSGTADRTGVPTNDYLSTTVASGSSEEARSTELPGPAPPELSKPESPAQSFLPVPAIARPPPGLTMESWKDPALTGEERRRRRFGRGVRNLAAIQRSCDARRGAANAQGAAVAEGVPDREVGVARPDPDRARDEEGSIANGAPGGSSVFSFGFDIGISFNGGS